MELRMNGKMTPAFMQRRLYAGLCVGPWHRLEERRSQREGGFLFFAPRSGPRGFLRLSGVGGAGLSTDGPSPLGHGPQSSVPKGPAPISCCGGLRAHGAVSKARVIGIAAFIRPLGPPNTAVRGPLRPGRTPL